MANKLLLDFSNCEKDKEKTFYIAKLDDVTDNLENIFKRFKRKFPDDVSESLEFDSFKEYIMENLDVLTEDSDKFGYQVVLNYEDLEGIANTKPLSKRVTNRKVHFREENADNSTNSFIKSKMAELTKAQDRDLDLSLLPQSPKAGFGRKIKT